MKFKAGDTYTIAKVNSFVGVTTNGAKGLYFTLILPKNADGLTVTVTCTDLTVRHGSATILNIADYSPSFMVNGNLLTISLQNDTAFSITNNTIVGIAGTFNIKFS